MDRRHHALKSQPRRSRTLACAALLSLWAFTLVGCDGRSPSDTINSKGPPTGEGVPAPVPATAPAVPDASPGAATQPTSAGKQAAPSIPSMLVLRRMTVAPNGAPLGDVGPGEDQPTYLHFPPARLIASAEESAVELRLFSDDPKEAINKNWVGDRYYFQFNPQSADAANLTKLDNATWRATASYDETEESQNGVFLRGDRYHLEPVDVLIRVEGDAPQVRVMVNGVFKRFDASDPAAKAAFFEVSGILMPKVEAEK